MRNERSDENENVDFVYKRFKANKHRHSNALIKSFPTPPSSCQTDTALLRSVYLPSTDTAQRGVLSPHTHTSVFTCMHTRTPPPKTFVSHHLTTSWGFSFFLGAYPHSFMLSVVRHAGKQWAIVGSKVLLPLSVSACDFPRFFETELCYVCVVCR